MVGPSSAVTPGTRKAWGPIVTGSPWGLFIEENDFLRCYPPPQRVADRLRLYPQASVGNALRDPLPVPFTAQEVRDALIDVWQKRKLTLNSIATTGGREPDRVCAPASAASVNIALEVLPILESRNGGWIDFVQGRREDPYLNRPWEPRADVFNLRCLLHQLPGKPLSRIDAAPCNWEQPHRLEALYNIADVRTTFAGAPSAPAPAAPSGFLGPGPRPFGPTTAGSGSEGPLLPPLPPPAFLGLHLEGELPAPEPFSFSLFELFQANDIKGA